VKPRRLDELTYVEVAELVRAGADTVVLPVGTVEPHGPHLPLGTDTLIAEAIAELVAAKLNALLLPALPYGVTGSLHGYPGSVRVEPEVLEKLAYSVLESVALSGFKYALIVNGHGGNTPSLEAAARRAWYERRLATMVVDWWVLARERGITQRVLGKEGGHAATDETAIVLAVKPQLAKRELYSSSEVYVHSAGVRAYPLPGTVINYTPQEGDVTFPPPEECRQFLEEVAEAIANLFTEFKRAAAKAAGRRER
jgi:creatinine amidohydrolase